MRTYIHKRHGAVLLKRVVDPRQGAHGGVDGLAYQYIRLYRAVRIGNGTLRPARSRKELQHLKFKNEEVKEFGGSNTYVITAGTQEQETADTWSLVTSYETHQALEEGAEVLINFRHYKVVRFEGTLMSRTWRRVKYTVTEWFLR